MSGIFGQLSLLMPQKRVVKHSALEMDSKALELETAKEILAEVFRIRVADVDEMILNRFGSKCSKEDGLWPQEFCLEG